ncbi:MAG: DUF3237 family protein [Actinomycetota bacterium]|nr:DUF3237 family protein [Actinomycetota bacterium]
MIGDLGYRLAGFDQIEHLAAELDRVSPWHDDLLIISAQDSSTPPARSQGQTSDLAAGLLATAPTFQSGSEKYKWLNEVQAVAAGNANLATGDLVYQLYEVKVTV